MNTIITDIITNGIIEKRHEELKTLLSKVKADKAATLQHPVHKHDCDTCIFLGTKESNGRTYDYYKTSPTCNPVTSIIARYGNDERDYTSRPTLQAFASPNYATTSILAQIFAIETSGCGHIEHGFAVEDDAERGRITLIISPFFTERQCEIMELLAVRAWNEYQGRMLTLKMRSVIYHDILCAIEYFKIINEW